MHLYPYFIFLFYLLMYKDGFYIRFQVDDFHHWIPQDTAGIGGLSRKFPPFPGRNKLKPAGNIHIRWKQYSGRKHTVPRTVLLQIFLVTGITQKLTGTPPYPPENSQKPHVYVSKPMGCLIGYCFPSYRSKIH
jgi:hypothetical protein